jgi:hypothetical protein
MWDEATARRWFNHTIFNQTALVMRALKNPVQWFDGAELPDEYSDFKGTLHGCQEDTLRAVEAHPELRAVVSLAFRAEELSRGIGHFFSLAPARRGTSRAAVERGLRSGHALGFGFLPG